MRGVILSSGEVSSNQNAVNFRDITKELKKKSHKKDFEAE